ncbi:DUF5068 domain-containing protein [Halobacillus kuroshimensis]|uniref:DUF5068 domain-containing protein n=1 Tax=Halobacillus kuroshimensis TaxID=302481 RepID=A0ABS3DWF6_9BACI|nr:MULTISPECIES: DUF5068 domain-containing protein [Halobacillus]MBN8235653.1 DUF5068 domain-containing protein [Halobacillus kuroshimensis]
MPRRIMGMFGILCLLVFVAACGQEETSGSTENEEPTENTEETNTNKQTAEETKKEQPEAVKEETSSSSNEIMNPNIAEQTEGNVDVVYTNDDPGFTHDMDGFQVTVDKYQIVKVTDMNEDMYIEFDDQSEGYVITSEVTINNTKDKAMYYPTILLLQGVNEVDALREEKTFVREEYPVSETEEEYGKYGAGEEVSGLVTFTLTNDQYQVLQDVNPKMVIEDGAADNKQFENSFKGSKTFDFILGDEEQATENAGGNSETSADFYRDELTTGNLAEKEMLFEESGLEETKSIGDVDITLNGVQYTEINPTQGNESRFDNFGDNGIVALTVKLSIDNQSDKNLNIFNFVSKVYVDGDRGSVLSQGMVEPSDPKEIAAGASGEKLHVFLFRKDDFDTVETFDLEFGPFMGPDGKDLFKGETAMFKLPR